MSVGELTSIGAGSNEEIATEEAAKFMLTKVRHLIIQNKLKEGIAGVYKVSFILKEN